MNRSPSFAPGLLVSLLALPLATACGASSEPVSSSAGDRSGVRVRPAGSGADGGAADADAADNSGNADNPNLPRFDCSEPRSQQFDRDVMSPYRVSTEVSAQVDSTLEAMGPLEMASQMLGVPVGNRNYRDIDRSPDVEVPGVGMIRGFRYRDGSRGVNLQFGQDTRPDDGNNFATVFPTTSLRAASWDLDLERRIGAAIGDETAASKNNVLLAPSMNIVRHPYWGRTQETYGEDMYLIGRMATAFAVGVQEYVLACAKHWAGNNIEKDRAVQNAVMTEQTLREIYGRHFEMVVQDGGVGCVMAAYNQVNGVKLTQNRHLLRDVLKGPIEQGGFGFQGLVITDWWAMPGNQDILEPGLAQALTNEAVLAGTDIEMPWTLHYSAATLANAEPSLVEEATRRILTQKYRFKTALDSDGWGLEPPTSTLTEGSITPNENHEALAEEAAVKSAVLLSNGLEAGAPVVPLTAATTIAVVGPDQEFSQISSSVPKSCPDLSAQVGSGVIYGHRTCTFHFATDPALGDRGTSLVNGDPERAVGPFEGIQELAGADRTVTSGNSAEAAADADAVVVVVGYTPGDEGEEYYLATGGDRSSLNLPAGHNELVTSVLDLMKPTVVIIESGSIVNLPWLSHANKNQATIWAGYPGLRGGLALGKLIFGEANFAGKMPMAWPMAATPPPVPIWAPGAAPRSSCRASCCSAERAPRADRSAPTATFWTTVWDCRMMWSIPGTSGRSAWTMWMW